jgi:histidinol-phosphate aminotransferase
MGNRPVTPKRFLTQVWRTPPPTESREGFELMDRNERTIDFPPQVMADLRALITPFLLRAYPEPERLYQKLAAWLDVPREMLLITMAADGGLRSIFDTFVEPGDEVVSVTPSYAMYPVYCGISGAVSNEVRFNDDLSLPLDRVLERITEQTKLVVLANPNQPIERVYDHGELRALLEACARHRALLVMDEAYYHFCPQTAAPLIPEHDRLVVVRSFSKAFGIAGIRLGYLLSRPETIALLTKVRPMYETHSIAVAVGCYLLDHIELMRAYVDEVHDAKTWLVAAFRRLGIDAVGRWSNSVLVSLPSDLPARELVGALRGRRFLVRAETQPPLSNHLRITVGSTAQAERFLAAFEAAMEARDGLGRPASSL